MIQRKFLYFGGLVFLAWGFFSSSSQEHLLLNQPGSASPEMSFRPTKYTHKSSRNPRLNRDFVRFLLTSHSPDSPQQLDGFLDTAQPWTPMTVYVYVTNKDGSVPESGVVHSQTCSIYQPVGADGFVELQLSEDCDLFASRRDGVFMAFSEEDWVSFEPGTEWDLELDLPTHRIGGIGLSIDKVEDGFLVQHIFPGMPGDSMGLAVGDIIIEIDGYEASSLLLYDFIQIATGEEGTSSTLRIKGDSYDDPPREYIRSRLDGS